MGPVELAFLEILVDSPVHPLCPHGNVLPAVHLLDFVMEPLRPDLVVPDRVDCLARRNHQVVLLRFGKYRHVGGQNLRNASDLGAHHVQSAACRLHNDSAKGLGQAWVEIYVALDHHIPHFFVADGSQQLNLLLQHVLLYHLLKVYALWSIPSDDETGIGVILKDPGNSSDEEVGALVVEKARDDNDRDGVIESQVVRWLGAYAAQRMDATSLLRFVVGCMGPRGPVVERLKIFRDNGIGDDGNHRGIERRTKNGVLLAGVAHTYYVVHVAEGELQHLVGENAGCIGKAEERVVCKDRANAHRSCMQDGFVTKVTQAPMAVDNVDVLAQNDISEKGKEGEDCGKGSASVYDEERTVVDLYAVGEPPNTSSVVVGVGDDDDFVSAVDKLGRKLVDVAFDSSWLREEEVAHHGNIARPSRIHLPVAGLLGRHLGGGRW